MNKERKKAFNIVEKENGEFTVKCLQEIKEKIYIPYSDM